MLGQVRNQNVGLLTSRLNDLFQPSDSDAISEDISDAETESDIECEKVGESNFVQLKEKMVSLTYIYAIHTHT